MHEPCIGNRGRIQVKGLQLRHAADGRHDRVRDRRPRRQIPQFWQARECFHAGVAHTGSAEYESPEFAQRRQMLHSGIADLRSAEIQMPEVC